MAQATRLRMLLLLAERVDAGLSSGDLADLVGIPRNLASSHLAVLGAADVVSAKRDGRTVTYRINPSALLELNAFLEGLARSD